MKCPCDSNKTFDECCGPYISGEAIPPTAEALMRSRYTAYTKSDVEYIRKTTELKPKAKFDMAGTKKWADESEWKGLKILKVEQGGPTDKLGIVEFVATYVQKGETIEHHEVSTFRKTESGRWIFKDGHAHTHKDGEGHHHANIETASGDAPKISRNGPCPCGSGKKYKRCCA